MGEPSKTTKRTPDIFRKKPQRRVQAVDIFGSRGYRYRTIESVDIMGTGKKKKIPDIFGTSKKKKKKSLKIF